MPSGDFTQKAYQQLRDAYADSLSTQDEQELAGKEILGQQMSLETLPVNSPWRSQIKDWQYPNGKSEYLDGKQSPEEILELMRDSVRAKVEEDEAEEEMSDEELEAILAQLLDEEEEAAENEYDYDDDDDEEEDDDEEGEADESAESYEIEDEEEDDLDDDLIADDDEEEEEEEEEEEYEDDDEEEDEEEEEYDEEEEEVDPEQVAAEIAELKEQIESFRFSNISDEDLEE